MLFSNYSYFLHTIPFFVYLFYIVLRDSEYPLFDKVLKIGLKCLGIYLLYFIYNFILGTELKYVIPIKWSYSAPITWGFLFFIYYYVLKRKGENVISSITLSVLATFGGGWLYEVSFFHPVSMFLCKGTYFFGNIQIICLILFFYEMKIKSFKHRSIIVIMLVLSSILIVVKSVFPNGQIVCLLLLAYELRKRNFTPNKIIYIALIFFISFSIMLFMNTLYIWELTRYIFRMFNVRWLYIHAQTLKWVYRIPASIFLLSLLTGIKKNTLIIEGIEIDY